MLTFYLVPFFIKINETYNYLAYEGFFRYKNHFLSLEKIIKENNFELKEDFFLIEEAGFKNYFSIPFYLTLKTLFVVLLFLYRRKNNKREFSKLVFFYLLSLVFVFLTTDKSLFIWDKLNLLRYLQYPFRLLNIAIISTTIFLFLVLRSIKIIRVKKIKRISLKVIIIFVFLFSLFSNFKNFTHNKNVYYKKQEFAMKRQNEINIFNPNYECYVLNFARYDFLPKCVKEQGPFRFRDKLKNDFFNLNGVNYEEIVIKSNKIRIFIKERSKDRTRLYLPSIFFDNIDVYLNREKIKYKIDPKNCLIYLDNNLLKNWDSINEIEIRRVSPTYEIASFVVSFLSFFFLIFLAFI
ncbi:MAG: hypothetical protein NZL96_03885 [Patescibacteria group bacterium]|nr:hypothetical protein [Patescibacteria group bacterium]